MDILLSISVPFPQLLSSTASEKSCLSFVLGYTFIITYTPLFEGYLLKVLVILVYSLFTFVFF